MSAPIPVTEAHYTLRRDVIYSAPDDGAQFIAASEARAVAKWQNSAHLKGEAIDSLLIECDRLRAEVKESKERERVAIASWEEERQRALREGGQVVELRAEVERLRNQRDNLLKPMREQAIARAERAEGEVKMLGVWREGVIENAWAHKANLEGAIARAERAEAESIQLKKTNVENADSYRLMQGRVIAAEVEVERLKARLYQGCDDERDMAISEGPGHSTCGLADELTARAERAEAERDQLRAQLATCKDASEALVGSLRVEVERWEFAFQEQYARAESAEREVELRKRFSSRTAIAEHRACRAEAEVERLRAGIGECLRANAHLADGEDCTLIGLKRCLHDPAAAPRQSALDATPRPSK